ncbi:MAG: hypothetical protein ACKOCD_02925 [Nitrospiraceae bacterium]
MLESLRQQGATNLLAAQRRIGPSRGHQHLLRQRLESGQRLRRHITALGRSGQRGRECVQAGCQWRIRRQERFQQRRDLG